MTLGPRAKVLRQLEVEGGRFRGITTCKKGQGPPFPPNTVQISKMKVKEGVWP